METQYQKYVNLAYLCLAVLVGYVIFTGASDLVSVYDIEAKFKNVAWAVRGLSFGIGALLFLLLIKNQQANQFMNEVALELSRVTWPTQKETTSATFVVIVMVLISGMILGLLDYFWTQVVQWILS